MKMAEKAESGKGKKRKKLIRILIVILLVLLLLFGAGYVLLNQMAKSVGIGGGETADYERRIPIWNEVAGNRPDSKLSEMNVKKGQSSLITTFHFLQGLTGSEYKDSESVIDTYTYMHEIQGGFEKETFEDEPYLIPYLVDGSDRAVIVIPGGGFGYKSMDGSTGEGKDIAVKLNEAGISAFVLHYRSNPYEYPLPYLDLGRAVKFLRFCSAEYGIDPEKISAIGFSAGGNLICHYINHIQNGDFYPEDYEKDEVDAEDGTLTDAAMIYPATTFNANVPMLFAMFDAEDVRDEDKRADLLDLMDNTKNFDSAEVRQFVAYGRKDRMVGTSETPAYIEKAKAGGADVTDVFVKDADHGFAPDNYFEKYIRWLQE